MPRMNRTRTLLFASVVTTALVFGGVIGAAAARSGATPLSVLAASSPSPTFKSNEDSKHEAAESAAQEAAENNGTFHPGGPGGPGGPPPNGMSNETSTHEAQESASQEAAEKS